MISFITDIATILYIPYVFTPLVLLVCLLSCIIVIKYKSLRDEDVMFIIFAVIICVLIKTSTISILDSFIPSPNQPVFLYAYFSIHLLRNMISLFQLKLQEQCYYSPPAFVANFSLIGFIVFIPIYCVLFMILIFKCINLAPSKTLPITIPEFIIIPFEVAYVIYNFIFIRMRCFDNQWSKRFVKYFFVGLHFEFISIGFLTIHYTTLFIYVWGQKLMGIWIGFQIFRMLFVAYAKIKSVQKYFTHLHLMTTLKTCELNEGDCSICYSTLKKKCVVFPCGHKFHHSCVISWLQHNTVCPLCKQTIVPLQINHEKYVMRLPKSSRFMVRLYQFIFKGNTVEDEVQKVKDTFPMIPDGVILQQLERFSTSIEVINYFADHPDVINEYSNNSLDNDNQIENEEPQHETDLIENIQGIDDDSFESDGEDDEDINFEELHRISELRKRKLIEDNL